MFWVLPFILMLVAGYVCGATPFGYFAGRLKGIDIREHGSGNIGATNVIRVCGKGVGIPTFVLDVIKGWLPAWLSMKWSAEHGASDALASAAGIASGLAAVLGHNFTFWLRGRGGKGVATSAGALLATAPIVLVVVLAFWFVTLKVTRYVSLASMVAGAGIPLTMCVQMLYQRRWNFVLLGFGLLLAALTLVRHRSNIQRLLAGTENKIGQKKRDS